jgi:hypothetical protein
MVGGGVNPLLRGITPYGVHERVRRPPLLLVCLTALALSNSQAAALTMSPGQTNPAPVRITTPGACLWRFVNPWAPDTAREGDVAAPECDAHRLSPPAGDTTAADDSAAAHSAADSDPWKVRYTLFAQPTAGSGGAGASRPGPRDGPTPAGLLVHIELSIPGAVARVHLDGGPLRLPRHPGKVFRPPKG